MRVLLDANVLLRGMQPAHPHAKAAQLAMTALGSQRHELCLVPQVVYEFWVVLTRPEDVNGLGLTADAAAVEVASLLAMHSFVDDRPGVFQSWRELVTRHAITGKPAHDARLVAAMRIHGIPAMLTFNATDFRRYEGIDVIDPHDVPSGSASS